MSSNSLPSLAVLYGTYLLGQAFARGYTKSWDAWISMARQLPTGQTTPRNMDRTAERLAELGLAGVSPDGTVWLDTRILLAGSAPSDEVLARLLVLLASQSPPLWTSVADVRQGPLILDYIPSADMHTLQALCLDGQDPNALIRTIVALAHQQVDTEGIGALGEKACVDHEVSRLISLGRADLAEQVVQVSLISESFGYDISSFFSDGQSIALEVKATTQDLVSVFPCFLSRHEYSVAQAAPSSWRLAAVHLTGDTATVLGYFSLDAVEHLVPSESEGFHWTEARLLLPLSRLTSEP